MALPVQPIDIPLSGGIDQKARVEVLQPPGFRTLTNLRQIKRGSYQKRLGINRVIAATAATKVHAYKDELLSTDATGLLKTYGSAALAVTNAYGRAPQCAVKTQPIASLQYGAAGYDITYANGYYVVAWVSATSSSAASSYAVYAGVIDATTGSYTAMPVQLASSLLGTSGGNKPYIQLLALGSKVFCFFSQDGGTATKVYQSHIDLTSFTTIATGWSAQADLITDGGAVLGVTQAFDTVAISATQFVIAYPNNANIAGGASLTITVKKFDATPTQVGSSGFAKGSTATTGAVPLTVSIDGVSTDTLYVAYGFDTTTTAIAVFNPSTLTTTAGPSFALPGGGNPCIVRTGTGTGIVLSDGGGILYMQRFNGVVGSNATAVGTAMSWYGMTRDIRPFAANGRLYGGIRATGDAQLFVVDITQTLADAFGGVGYLRPVANISPRLAYYAGTTGPLVRAAALSSSKFVTLTASLENATSSSLDLATLDFAAPNLCQSANIQESLVLAGGIPSVYDGNRCSEIGFLMRPSGGASLTGTGITGTLSYIATYETIDARGQWHQSNVSNPWSATPANQTVRNTVTPLRASWRADGATLATYGQVRIVLWRTVDSGTVYLRVPGSETLNNPSVATVTIDDATADASLGAPCYAQPGIPNTAQPRTNPPAFSCMTVHGDRVVGACGKTVWPSGQAVQGEGVWFADLFQFNVETGGDITALASIDGALVIFKRNAIAYVDGQGPADNGTQNDYTSPQFVALDVGCVEPRSVVVMEDGVLFQSERGLELLTRGRQVSPFFGSQMEDTLDANPVITSAVVDESKGLVLFTCAPGIAGGGGTGAGAGGIGGTATAARPAVGVGGLLNVNFLDRTLFPLGTISDADFYFRTGILHTGPTPVTIVAGGLSIPDSSGKTDFWTIPQADVYFRLVNAGRISFEVAFVAGSDAVIGTSLNLWVEQGGAADQANAVTTTGLLRATVGGSNLACSDPGFHTPPPPPATQPHVYWLTGDSVQLFVGAGGNLALAGASLKPIGLEETTGSVHAANVELTQDIQLLHTHPAMTISRMRCYVAGARPTWAP